MGFRDEVVKKVRGFNARQEQKMDMMRGGYRKEENKYYKNIGKSDFRSSHPRDIDILGLPRRRRGRW